MHRKRWPAVLNLLEADAERAVEARFLLGDAPPEVDADEVRAAPAAAAAQLGKNDTAQVVAFRVHVAERGRDEYPDGPGSATSPRAPAGSAMRRLSDTNAAGRRADFDERAAAPDRAAEAVRVGLAARRHRV